MTRLCLLISLFLAASAAVAVTAAAKPGQAMTFEAPGELLDDARRDAALDDIASFGIRRVRVLVYWDQFAPQPGSRKRPAFDAKDPGAYPPGTWDRLDRLFDAAAERGITVQPTLTGPVPRWATKARRDRLTEPSSREFERWAIAVGRRYGDRVGVWSIWNEPNHPQFLLPQFRKRRPASPRIYRRLYLAGHRGLRASPSNANDLILAGETAPRGTPRVVAPLDFLRGTLCLSRSYRRTSSRCKRLPALGWAHHAYTTKSGPSFRPPDRDDVTIGVLSRLTRALDRAAARGAIGRRLPVHLTEFGVQSAPDPFVGVPLAKQAQFLAWSEAIAWRNPRVATFSQYLLHDDQPRPGPRAARYSGFESGLRAADGTPKPAYMGFRLPLDADLRGPDVKLWGLVRPAAGATKVTIMVADKGDWRDLRTITTTARGSFALTLRHRPGRKYQLRWLSPSGAEHFGAVIRPH